MAKNIIQRIGDYIAGKTEKADLTIVEKRPDIQALYGTGVYVNSYSVSWNGEKGLGEMGPGKFYYLDYPLLRLRSWQAYHENLIAQTVIDRFTSWVLGNGLKLQSQPVLAVLRSEGINIDKNSEEFNDIAEGRFSVWANDRMSDHSGMNSANILAREAFKNTKIGGDVLVILRYDGCITVQLVDGAHVQSPAVGSDYMPEVLSNGNTIRNGIEMDPKGQHVAYYIRKEDYSIERVEARSRTTGLLMSYMVYGDRYRLDNHRGVPKIAVALQTLKNIERYLEATIGSAEERAKIVMQIVHEATTSGTGLYTTELLKASGLGTDAQDLPTDTNGNELANKVAVSTNKSVHNMPPGAKLEALESKTELAFKEFYGTNADIICAAVGIPPNVAFSLYNDSFSASRTATKDWDHTIDIEREAFSFQYYQPLYELFIYTEVLKNKVTAKGYLKAFMTGNKMALAAYHKARFTGPHFPHIDPLKEANAERKKLGVSFDHLPLTTMENATESLMEGEYRANVKQAAKELEEGEELGLEPAALPAGNTEKITVEEDKDEKRK